MKNSFKVNRVDSRSALAFLFLRIVLGLGLMFHGWPKIQNPMAWVGDGAPAFLQLLAAISEFGGGLSLILGLLVPLSSFGIFCTMSFAVYIHAVVKGDPFVGKEGSYELALIYLIGAVFMLLAGPGQYSVDHKLFGAKNKGN
jgi:putative oxidoreductase